MSFPKKEKAKTPPQTPPPPPPTHTHTHTHTQLQGPLRTLKIQSKGVDRGEVFPHTQEKINSSSQP